MATCRAADELLSSVMLSDGRTAKAAVSYVAMCPGLSKTRLTSETLRATMVKSSMESLRRRTKVRVPAACCTLSCRTMCYNL